MSQQFLHIPGLLKSGEIFQVEEKLKNISFVDGKATATMAAREVKNNLQADKQTGSFEEIQDILQNAINTSPYVQAAAQPKRVNSFIISKYEPGHYYGWHVDSPLTGNPPLRADLAMTIFLSDPNSYEGGELIIQGPAGQASIKAAKGDAILYPCQYLHCVGEIKNGERLAAVTWIQSNIRDASQRQLLFEMNQVQALIQQKDAHSPEASLIMQVYANLFRMWADV